MKEEMCSSCFRDRYVNKETYEENRSIQKQTEELTTTTIFYCCGRTPPLGPYRKRHGMWEPVIEGSKRESSVECAYEAFEDSALGAIKIRDPKIPFSEDLPEELYQGRAIEICGKLIKNASRFSINLSTGNSNDSDIALHFNPRFDRCVVVRNHRIRKKWGVEEITSLQNFPFTVGRNFSVLIFVADEQFLIAINKLHYCAFSFRIPVEKIKSLIILGDIILNFIQHTGTSHYPPLIFKKTPFIIIPHSVKLNKRKCNFRRKVKNLTDGSKIEIFGRLKLLPKAFYINIQNGISLWPHPIIPFHMNYRLHPPGTNKKEREIIFNSWCDGFWGKEEIITFCPFLPGTAFHLKILCQPNSFNVTVNDKFLYNFSKRVMEDVNAVVIHGDVIINKVVLL